MKLFYLIALLVFFQNSAVGQEVYKHIAEDGTVSYSTKPQSVEDRPAKLAPLQRESVDARIKELKSQTPKNCGDHGGIDCSQGEDSDGSVICLDGYRAAILPYRFSCVEANLRVEGFTLNMGEAGEPTPVKNLKDQSWVKDPKRFQVLLRNRSAAAAEEIRVSIFLDRKREISAKGPKDLEAYGLAEFSAEVPPGIEAFNRLDMKRLRYKVRCRNCRSVLKGSN